ncbi:MerC domain-containing protein [Bowmanella denitrificans]|uniref:MerC domain-containing protein n=1 Tax=Bowmanella denitrificans TaxID=366582 RepID=UPI000C9BF3A5|nr:MerC domain-containing protein [Bowmanella denitrificans]
MKLQNISDKAAVGLSALCVVHCLFMPIILILIPPLSGVLALNDELFHIWLLFAVVPISSIALLMGYFHHRNRHVFVIGALGLTILVIAAVMGHDLLGEYGEVAMTVVGSCIIAFGHVRNYQLGRQQQCTNAHQEYTNHD